MPYNVTLVQQTTTGAISSITNTTAIPPAWPTSFDYLLHSMWMCLPGNADVTVTWGSAFTVTYGAAINSFQLSLGHPQWFSGFYRPAVHGSLSHVIFSADAINQIVQVYVNDFPIPLSSGGFTGSGVFSFFSTLSLVDTPGLVLAPAPPGYGDLWSSYTDSFFDLSITANRRKFINADLSPVFLGDHGQLPIGRSPPVFLSSMTGTAADLLTNYGTGGPFLLGGSTTVSLQPPGTCTIPPIAVNQQFNICGGLQTYPSLTSLSIASSLSSFYMSWFVQIPDIGNTWTWRTNTPNTGFVIGIAFNQVSVVLYDVSGNVIMSNVWPYTGTISSFSTFAISCNISGVTFLVTKDGIGLAPLSPVVWNNSNPIYIPSSETFSLLLTGGNPNSPASCSGNFLFYVNVETPTGTPVVNLVPTNDPNSFGTNTGGLGGPFSSVLQPQLCGSPCPPTNLTCGTATETSITTQWVPSTLGGPVTSYTLQYRVQGTSTWTQITGIVGTSQVITGLVAGTTYEWQVQSLNAIGSSAFSTSGFCATLAQVIPPLGLTIMTVTEIDVKFQTSTTTDHMVTLRWSDDQGASWDNGLVQSLGLIGEYETSVQWRRIGMSRNRVIEISWSGAMAEALTGVWINYTLAAT